MSSHLSPQRSCEGAEARCIDAQEPEDLQEAECLQAGSRYQLSCQAVGKGGLSLWGAGVMTETTMTALPAKPSNSHV